MSICSIKGFLGANNMQDPSALKQPARTQAGWEGMVELVECVNYDIDDNGGLVCRDVVQPVFTKTYDAKLSQKLKGRKYTVSANKLKYTKPYSEEYDPRRCTIAYPAPIILIQEVEDGMWVSTTERIYFHKGTNPTEINGFTQHAEYTFPAIMGTGEKVSCNKLLLQRDGFVALFATTFGICMGTDDGVLTNLSEATFSYVPGARGISHVKEANGMIQYQVKFIDDTGASYNQQPALDITIDEV
jgi:hypothetical protein